MKQEKVLCRAYAHYLMGEFIKKFVNLARTLSWKFNKNINRNWGNQKSAHLNRNPCNAHPLLLPPSGPAATPAAWQDAQPEIHAGAIFFLLSVDSTCHTTSLNALPRQGVASVGHSPCPSLHSLLPFFLLALAPCPFLVSDLLCNCCFCYCLLYLPALLFLLHCVASLILHSYLLASVQLHLSSPCTQSLPCFLFENVTHITPLYLFTTLP